MAHTVYDTLRWRLVSGRARRRDGERCSVARLLGGECSATLHVHHLTPVTEGGAPYDLDNLLTVCASHHPVLEAFRRGILGLRDRQERPVRCHHRHRTEEARRECERRMARVQPGQRVAA